MASGRRPTPTAIKALRGVQRGLNRHEPVPPPGELGMPGWLSAGARTVWSELAPVCTAMGTLTVADLKAFAVLCTLQSRIQQADDDDRALLRLANALRQYYALFGLEPISRAKIQVPKQEPVSKWAGLR
jgi:phage terminase small subunit